MPLLALAFLCGILIFQQLSHLPTLNVMGTLCLLFFMLINIKNKKIKYVARLLAIGLLGFIWCFCYLHVRHYSSFPGEFEGKNLTITGYIASIPITDDQRTHFLFSLDSIDHSPFKGLLQLSCQNKFLHFKAGEIWQFQVKLKKIHGTQNPGGFDYEAWAFEKGVVANGYLIMPEKAILLNKNKLFHPILFERQKLHDAILKYLPVSETSHWIMALAIGERENIDLRDWQILQNTGTNHLMAIGGLHMGFMSGFMYTIILMCWRRLPFMMRYLPAQHAAGIGALIIALIYSLMAGFSIPTERAFLCLSMFIMMQLLRRHLTPWYTLSAALIIVLLFNPLSILTESIWLSFGSIALIIYGMQNQGKIKNSWQRHAQLQWTLSVGLIPISIGLFHQCSLISFIANSIAIPCMGFILIPCTVLGCILLNISTSIGSFLLIFADKILSLLWIFLSYLANLPWSTWHKEVPSYWIIIAAMGVILLLFPRGLKFKWLGIIWLLPLIFYHPPVPKKGEVWFTLLDVGQGLSAVVQTQKHVLVFDTGVKLSENFDMGKNVILPFLQTIDINKIDMLVLSHGDNDHSGGAKAILQQIKVIQLKSSVPSLFKRADFCLQGENWRWDGVDFEFLYPTINHLHLGNDSSCVLRITMGNQHILLTGDIEKSAEKKLIENEKEKLSADILIAPHHGSRTSILPAFVESVNPKIVLFPVGYRNPYHFPNLSVINMYASHHSKMYDSVNAGAIQFYLNGYDILKPHLYRKEHKHYWNSCTVGHCDF